MHEVSRSPCLEAVGGWHELEELPGYIYRTQRDFKGQVVVSDPDISWANRKHRKGNKDAVHLEAAGLVDQSIS